MRCSFLWLMVMSCTLLHARDIHVAVCGNDANAGTVEAPYRTVSKAACEACPGDVITVHAGTYREWVRPLRGGGQITIIALSIRRQKEKKLLFRVRNL